MRDDDRAPVPTADVRDSCRSAAWDDASPRTSVVIATHNRMAFLTELFEALHRQHTPPGGFEVVIADDGSDDDTWQRLRELVSTATVPVLALRLAPSGGPSLPRNTAAVHARGALLAMTDDDCLPEPTWLEAYAVVGRGVAQGMTLPTGQGHGTWDRSIEIRRFSGLYETCNLAVDRPLFLRLGGFPVLSDNGRGARGFGEDVLLGVAAQRAAGSRWVPDAVVRHRWLPGTYRDHLAGRRRLQGFPMLLRTSPELRQLMFARMFLTRRSAAFDTAALSLVLALATRRGRWGLGVVPWLALAVTEARYRPGRPLPWRLGQAAVADAVAAASLVEGSVRHRRLLL